MQRIRPMHGPRPVTTNGAGRDSAALGPPDRRRRPWSLMVLLSVAQFMVILDATVVNVALPSIARSLGLAAGHASDVFSAFGSPREALQWLTVVSTIRLQPGCVVVNCVNPSLR